MIRTCAVNKYYVLRQNEDQTSTWSALNATFGQFSSCLVQNDSSFGARCKGVRINVVHIIFESSKCIKNNVDNFQLANQNQTARKPWPCCSWCVKQAAIMDYPH